MSKKIIKFWADWCGPCKVYAPKFKEATKDLQDVEVIECNVDENPYLAQKYGIRGIPATLFIVGEEVKGILTGNHEVKEVTKKIKESFDA